MLFRSLAAEFPLGVGIKPEDEQSRRLHVEPVNHERAGGPREHGPHSSGGAILLVRSDPGHREKARGLLDHRVPIGGVNDLEVLGLHASIIDRGGLRRRSGR